MTGAGATTEPLAAWLSSVVAFHGEATPPLCRLYLRLSPPPSDQTIDVSGVVVGPRCEYAQTLEAKYRFSMRSVSAGLLTEVVVPDPCYWTPQLPFLYRLTIEAKRDGTTVARHERQLGIRLLTATKRSLFLDRKRWVFRGVSRDHFPTESIDQWRRVEAAMLVRNPDESTCENASRMGVVIGAVVDPPAPLSTRDELWRLSRWPAVGIAFLKAAPEPVGGGAVDPLAATTPDSLGALTRLDEGAPRNFLIGGIVRPDRPPVAEPWAQVLLCWSESLSAGDADNKNAENKMASDAPIIALRRSRLPKSLAQARADCDRLQSDLAAVGDFAGYIV